MPFPHAPPRFFPRWLVSLLLLAILMLCSRADASPDTYAPVGILAARDDATSTSTASASAATSTSTSTTAALSIDTSSSRYRYAGCYNETTEVEGTGNARALAGGKNQMLMGTMTVPLCLAFCTSDGDSYRYAGLEYSRECWCSHFINSQSVLLDDSACDDPCDGASSVACGGGLKLTVYELQSSAASSRASPSLFGLGLNIGVGVSLAVVGGLLL
ncbi:hypothetical protein BROUX41_000113 [Berkeleyomyces rouxiae]|uniref:uncharacterized protein n=1 Tax=Berkeleyomyces rouxiae TaxID=2035830 RepID=UPI003B7F4008